MTEPSDPSITTQFWHGHVLGDLFLGMCLLFSKGFLSQLPIFMFPCLQKTKENLNKKYAAMLWHHILTANQTDRIQKHLVDSLWACQRKVIYIKVN